MQFIAGVDEAGRGALAGPVSAAAVILTPHMDPSIFKASKQLTPAKREELYAIIKKETPYICLQFISPRMIDKFNILKATLLAMKRAILRLKQVPGKVIVDGIHVPKMTGYTLEPLIKGDMLEPCISAASIIAKVARDRIMKKWSLRYPGYGFDQNKGYGTEIHFEALFSLGVSPIHRQSFNLSKQATLF